MDWSRLGKADEDMTSFLGQLVELRRRYPQLRAMRWLEGRRNDGSWDVLWLTPQGTEMTDRDWGFQGAHFLSYLLAPPGSKTSPLYVVLNAAPAPVAFTLPAVPHFRRWALLVDTAAHRRKPKTFVAGARVQAPAASVLLFAGAA